MPLPSIEEILDKDLFELLGIESVSDQQKQQLINTMTRTIEARVVNRVAALLGETDADRFKTIAESGDAEKLTQFLVDKQIDLPQIVSEEATKHRVEVAELVNLAKPQ